jgi:hypothetical protein
MGARRRASRPDRSRARGPAGPIAPPRGATGMSLSLSIERQLAPAGVPRYGPNHFRAGYLRPRRSHRFSRCGGHSLVIAPGGQRRRAGQPTIATGEQIVPRGRRSSSVHVAMAAAGCVPCPTERRSSVSRVNRCAPVAAAVGRRRALEISPLAARPCSSIHHSELMRTACTVAVRPSAPCRQPRPSRAGVQADAHAAGASLATPVR